ncbi:MAG: YihY/virulence factor BrkB family protein [Eubacteriales bacterium]
MKKQTDKKRPSEKSGKSMFCRLYRAIEAVMQVYGSCNLSRSAAGLSYYLLLALFPLIICFSIVVTQFRLNEGDILRLLESWIADDLEAIEAFTWQNPNAVSSTVIFFSALFLLIPASAGAFRCLSHTADEIQHTVTPKLLCSSRFGGIFGTIFSYLFAMILFLAVYISIFVMVLWEELTALLSGWIVIPAAAELLGKLRYLLLFLIFFSICYFLQYFMQPKDFSRRALLPGTCFCSVGMVLVTVYFSLFIRGSAKYSLVYGSLASMVLLLMWIFVCGNLVLLGVAINTVLHHNNDETQFL